MDRKQELLNYLCKTEEERMILTPLVDEVLFLERNLEELKKLPFIKTHPQNPSLQKATPAAKQYKELLQQYTNCIKILSNAGGHDNSGEDSPLRAWVRKHVNSE